MSSAAYVLQLLSAPAWGRLADKGFPRLMLAVGVLAPLIPSIACLCVPLLLTDDLMLPFPTSLGLPPEAPTPQPRLQPYGAQAATACHPGYSRM